MLHINELELLVLIIACKAFKNDLAGKMVHIVWFIYLESFHDGAGDWWVVFLLLHQSATPYLLFLIFIFLSSSVLLCLILSCLFTYLLRRGR